MNIAELLSSLGCCIAGCGARPVATIYHGLALCETCYEVALEVPAGRGASEYALRLESILCEFVMPDYPPSPDEFGEYLATRRIKAAISAYQAGRLDVAVELVPIFEFDLSPEQWTERRKLWNRHQLGRICRNERS